MGASFTKADNLFVHLDDGPNYSPGALVKGEVLLNVTQELHVEKVLIKAVGYEQTCWHTKASNGKHAGWEKHRRDLLSAVASPEGYAQPVVLPAGTQLQLPFRFTLPEGLPGSFEFADAGHDHLRAKIRYKVVAQVLLSGGQQGSLRAKAHFWVNEPLAPGASCVGVEDTQDLQACWCMHRGSVHLRANLEQECHVPGDEVVVRLEVDNSDSGVCFRSTCLALKHSVQLCAGERVHHQASEVLARAQQAHGPIKARSRRAGPEALLLRLRLPDSVQPTALGELAHSEFSLVVTLQASGLLQDAILELPLVIFQSADRLARRSNLPPGWDQAMVAPVTHLKVPPAQPAEPVKQALA